jgi:hypothetical protein
LSIEEDYFNDDLSKAPTCDIKDLKFEPAKQDLEELLASKENHFKLSTIISRNRSIAVEEDGSLLLLERFFIFDGLLWSKSGIEHFAIG